MNGKVIGISTLIFLLGVVKSYGVGNCRNEDPNNPICAIADDFCKPETEDTEVAKVREEWMKGTQTHQQISPEWKAYVQFQSPTYQGSSQDLANKVGNVSNKIQAAFDAQKSFDDLYSQNKIKVCKTILDINQEAKKRLGDLDKIAKMNQCESAQITNDALSGSANFIKGQSIIFEGLYKTTLDAYGEKRKANVDTLNSVKLATREDYPPPYRMVHGQLLEKLTSESTATWGDAEGGPYAINNPQSSITEDARKSWMGRKVAETEKVLKQMKLAEMKFNNATCDAVDTVQRLKCQGQTQANCVRVQIPPELAKLDKAPVAPAAPPARAPAAPANTEVDNTAPRTTREAPINTTADDDAARRKKELDDLRQQVRPQIPNQVQQTTTPQQNAKKDDSMFGLGGGTGLLLGGAVLGGVGYLIGRNMSRNDDDEAHYYPPVRPANPNPYPYPYPGPSPIPGPGPGGGGPPLGLPSGSYLGLSPMAPSSAKAGTPVSAMTVTVQTPSGSVYAGSDITIIVSCSVGNCLAGASTTSVKINNGSATFSNLIFTGSFTNITLTFTATNLPPVTTNTFSVSP